MIKGLYLPIVALLCFLAYTIYSQDLKAKDIREYKRKIVIYGKEKCSFCIEAKKLLDNKDIPYIDIDITFDKERYAKLCNETGQLTVPFIFINEVFIGGYQELANLNDTNQLTKLLNQL
jgi:glutaredoxin 3